MAAKEKAKGGKGEPKEVPLPKSTAKRNKLNIYLIKSTYKTYDSITRLAFDPEMERKEFPGVGVLYYRESEPSPPDWISDFFKEHEAIDQTKIQSSSSRAVLVVKVPYNDESRFFAIPFGMGRHLLMENAIEESFGLITTLNLLQEDSVKSLDRSTVAAKSKLSREQISRPGSVADFQIDFESDMVHAITGNSVNPDFGKVVTGKDALNVSAKVDIDNIKPFLIKCLDNFNKKDYQTTYEWIDKIKEVRNAELLNKLDEQLVADLFSGAENIWLAVPEVVDWLDFKGFKYSLRKKDEFVDELGIQDFLDQSGLDPEEASIADLKSNRISFWSNSTDKPVFSWPMYKCLNAEVELNGGSYILNYGKWYQVNSDFVDSVNEELKKVKPAKINFPDYDHASENAYNKELAKQMDADCLDAKNIMFGGGKSKFEFCDVLTKQKRFIHVKKYGGSSMLSHLFAQGMNSAELFIAESKFRQLVKEKVSHGYKNLIPDNNPVAKQYQVIYAIISKREGKEVHMPFFSKIVFKNVYKRLKAFGYEVYLNNIHNHKEGPADDEEDEE